MAVEIYRFRIAGSRLMTVGPVDSVQCAINRTSVRLKNNQFSCTQQPNSNTVVQSGTPRCSG